MRSEAESGSTSLWEQSCAFSIFFSSCSQRLTCLFSSIFIVHYAPDPSNTLFRVRGIDGNIHFQFEGQASLFSEGSTPERNAFISGGDERTLRTIISTAFFEGENWAILRKPNFLFGDVALDTDNNCSPGKGNGFIPLNGINIISQKASPTILWLSLSRSQCRGS